MCKPPTEFQNSLKTGRIPLRRRLDNTQATSGQIFLRLANSGISGNFQMDHFMTPLGRHAGGFPFTAGTILGGLSTRADLFTTPTLVPTMPQLPFPIYFSKNKTHYINL